MTRRDWKRDTRHRSEDYWVCLWVCIAATAFVAGMAADYMGWI